MALYYLDTSALVKLYVHEAGTEEVLRLVSRSAGHRLAVLSLSGVEFRSAIRKRERLGDLAPGVADQVLSRFEQHLAARYVTQSVNAVVLDSAKLLVDRHGLRAYDAVQLAGCVALRDASPDDEPTFVCADDELLRATASEGLRVINATRDPS